jgi:hypothetical protein
MVWGALPFYRQHVLAATLMLALASAGTAQAQCVASQRSMLSSLAIRGGHLALPSAIELENAMNCRRQGEPHTSGAHLGAAVRSVIVEHSSSDGVDTATRPLPSAADGAAPMDVQWRNVKGPEWVQGAPEWLQNARNFRRRGLPILHLWESSHMLLALGVNGHGVPGLYLTQKAD